MTTEDVERLRRLGGAHFKLSNGWATSVTVAQLSAIIVGAVPGIRDALGQWTPLLLLALAYLTALSRAVADRHKGRGDTALRQVEIADGLGRKIDPGALADALDDASPLVRWMAERERRDQPYFASTLPPSPARLVANVRESAWWTKRLAGDLRAIEFWKVGVIVAAGLLVLRAATLPPSRTPAASIPISQDLVELATAAVLFFLTQGPLRRAGEYGALRDGASRVEQHAASLARTGTITDAGALELAHEYQIARKGSPLVPTMWWRLRQRRLNALWKEGAASDLGDASSAGGGPTHNTSFSAP